MNNLICRIYILVLLSLVNVIFCCQLFAEQIEVISVTAGRQDQQQQDLALTLGSVGNDMIKKDNPQHISESLQSLSGVLINQLSGGQGHNAAIRMPINYSGYTLYLQDNIPLQSAAFFNHNALWWTSSNSGINRIEVLKGAGTALHGSGAVSGTINVITPDVADDPQWSVGALAGDKGYFRARGSYSTSINDQQGFRTSGAQLHNDGWRRHSQFDKSELNLLHQWQIDGDSSLKSTLIASKLNQQMNASLTQAQFDDDPRQSGLSSVIKARDPRRKTDYLRLASQWKYDSNHQSLALIPYVRHRTNDYIATWQQNMPKVETQVNSLGLLALSRFDVNYGDLPLGEVAVGTDIEASRGDNYSQQEATITTTGFASATYPQGHIFFDDTVDFMAFSPYGEWQQEWNEQLTSVVGARVDLYRFDFNNHLPAYDNDGFGNRSLASRSDNFQHLSPKLAINYRLHEKSNIYTRFAGAVRIPTANELYHLKTKDTSSQLGSLKEETSKTYEIGYNHSLDLGLGKLDLSAAYYYLDVSDSIVTAYDDLGAAYKTNAAKVTHQGIELASLWQLSTQWQLHLAYSRSEHQYKKYIQDQGRVNPQTGLSRAKNLKGNSLSLAPEYIANVRLIYDSEDLAGFSSMLEWQSIGDYWMDAENTRRADGYNILNLKFNYQATTHLGLHFRVTNVSDENYSLQTELRFGREQIQPGAPRLWYVGIEYQL